VTVTSFTCVSGTGNMVTSLVIPSADNNAIINSFPTEIPH
jgi:hypothetical protein